MVGRVLTSCWRSLARVGDTQRGLIETQLPVRTALAASVLCVASIFGGDSANAEQIIGRAHVIDGDTIEIAGARVRLHGIDAPELHQRCSDADADTPCGEISRDALRELAEGREAVCEGRDRDRYRRLVAVCRVAGQDLGRAMVRAGQAVAFTRYSLDYVPDEDAARAAKRGIWAGTFQHPADFRRERR
jgi:endonuclease YncB( thermonuclease family)